MEGKGYLRPLARLLPCMALLLCLLAVPAGADNLDGDLEGCAQTLAQENGAQVGWQLSRGDGSDQFQYNSTSATAGRKLYVVEVLTTVAYEQNAGNTSNCHMDFSLFYLNGSNQVCWTDDFEFNGASQDFMDNTAALKANQMDGVSIQLPADCQRILAVYFHKDGGPSQGQNRWEAGYLRVAQVSGTIGAVGTDASGYKYRDYGGVYVAGITNLTELNYYGWGSHLWRLNQPVDGANNSCAKSIFALELVAGSDGYTGRNGQVTVNYTDSLGITYDKTVTLQSSSWFLSYSNSLTTESIMDRYNLTADWLSSGVELFQMAAGYVGTEFDDTSYTSQILPYAATTFQIVMPRNITRINSITVQLDENDNLILQSVRLLELSSTGDGYWNGMLSTEYAGGWQGRLLAQSTGSSYTVNGSSSITFTNGSLTTRGLQVYAMGNGPAVDNSGEAVAVSVQIADVLGAGIESLLAANRSGYTDREARFLNSEVMNDLVGNDAWKAYYNIYPFYQECMTLSVTYLDTLGATRQVSIPFMTTYLLYLLRENDGVLSGGDWTTWISGILQQNENVGLPLRLAQYDSLVSVRLTYGQTPSGFTSSNANTIDASADPITIENICFYEGATSSNFNSPYDSEKLSCVLETSLTPAYSWSSSGAAGQQLSRGGSVSASLDAGTLSEGAPRGGRDFTDTYVVRIKTADIETAGTTNPVTVSLTYTDTAGQQHTTSTYSLQTLASNFYGSSYRGADASYQYERHMRRNCRIEFMVDIPGAATVDAISLTIDGTNEWQVEYVSVYKVDGVEQRWGERSQAEDGTVHLYWRRDFDESRQVAHVRQSVLLYANSPSKTIWFTTKVGS